MNHTPLISIDESERESLIAASIISREQEIMAYEINIAVYARALLSGNTSREMRENITEAIKAEERELQKCLVFCEALKAQIVPQRLAAAIAIAKKEKKNV